MRIKKLGEAKIDVPEELWFIEGKKERYINDRRLIDRRSDLKNLKSLYAKAIQMNTPSRTKPLKREAYFQARDEYQHELKETMNLAFQEILESSNELPILLQKYKDYDHPRQWRYCLFRGIIFELDKPNYSMEEIHEGLLKAFFSEIPAVPVVPEEAE